jgi:hypothetical protein
MYFKFMAWFLGTGTTLPLPCILNAEIEWKTSFRANTALTELLLAVFKGRESSSRSLLGCDPV